MKKIIGILGVAVFSMAIFFSANIAVSEINDVNLDTIISLASAQTEACASTGEFYWSLDYTLNSNLCYNNSGAPCGIEFNCSLGGGFDTCQETNCN